VVSASAQGDAGQQLVAPTLPAQADQVVNQTQGAGGRAIFHGSLLNNTGLAN